MTRDELITKCTQHLGTAQGAHELNHHDRYAQEMSALLDLLIEELVGGAPAARTAPSKTFNPEHVLNDIAIAIKHRCVSNSATWYIIYYHCRICCVPANVKVPPEVILHTFTEAMVQEGFSIVYWNQLKANVTKLYKELNK